MTQCADTFQDSKSLTCLKSDVSLVKTGGAGEKNRTLLASSMPKGNLRHVLQEVTQSESYPSSLFKHACILVIPKSIDK